MRAAGSFVFKFCQATIGSLVGYELPRRIMMKFALGLALTGIGILGAGPAAAAKDGPKFDFARDTFAFSYETIFDYRVGVAYERPASSGRHRPSRCCTAATTRSICRRCARW